jgi:hypothetical protein
MQLLTNRGGSYTCIITGTHEGKTRTYVLPAGTKHQGQQMHTDIQTHTPAEAKGLDTTGSGRTAKLGFVLPASIDIGRSSWLREGRLTVCACLFVCV